MNTDNWLERTELLLGKEKLDLLRKAHVLVVGWAAWEPMPPR